MRGLILHNISELVTCKGSIPKCGYEMREIGKISDGCVVIEDGIIIDVGRQEDNLSKYDLGEYEVIDCKGCSVLPGFIDSHTHFVFGGYREKEFSMRLAGASYMDIMRQGGGIQSSVNSTRETTEEELVQIGMIRADKMMEFGVTTVEGKSGYGLDKDTELKQLRAMKEIDQKHPIDVISTFMGAHSVPKEYKGRSDEFLDMLINEVLPAVKKESLAEFCDIFCEKGVFSVEQSRRYLQKAKDMGFFLKIHADEIVSLGGAELAAELNAVSADHLLAASDEGIRMIAESKTVATLLPMTAFSLKEEYADARKMIDAGCAVALASDFNPGSCPSNSIPLLIALSAIYMKMSIEEIVTALTINAACALNRQDTVGSIEIGKKADIIILEYPSIEYLPYNMGVNIVKTVIKDGKITLSK